MVSLSVINSIVGIIPALHILHIDSLIITLNGLALVTFNKKHGESLVSVIMRISKLQAGGLT